MFTSAIILTAALLASSVVHAQYQQCGGIGWSGSTTCSSPYICVYMNDYYSQCQPVTSISASRTTAVIQSSVTRSSISSTATCSGTIPRLKGVNMAGYDFSITTDGSFTNAVVAPPASQFQHFASQGVNLFRIPFAWQEMTPTVGGTIDSSFFSQYDATVQQGLTTGAYVIVDLHNYARWNGGVINQGSLTIPQFASIWSQLAAKYANSPRIIFGVMNEPHNLPSIGSWVQAVQGAVDAIRSAGATCQLILIPGSSWSSAQALPTEAGPQLLNVTDPSGGTNRLIFDVHQYLDSDNSGSHDTCVTDNGVIMQTLVSWLQSNGNRQALLSETGGGHTQSCYTYLNSELAYIKSAYPSMLGFAVWAAGGFATSYTLSVTPNSDGSDQQLWIQAVKPNL